MKVWKERELLQQALIIISRNIDGLNTSQLIDKLIKELNPEGDDLEILQNRKDTYFSQKVRNLISHKTLSPFIEVKDGNKMIINAQGIDYLNENDEYCEDEDTYSDNIEENDDFRDENEGFNISEKTIELDNMYLSVSDLKRKYDRRKNGITANTLKLDVPFQRYSDIWSRKNKSLFIESILLNIPIPSIYLAEDNEGTLIVIDGRQRLSTLFDFIDDKFRLNGLSIMANLNGKKFSGFTNDFIKYKSKLEDRSLHIAKIRYGTDETFVIETFERVNTKGARLNAQEIRNALHQGKSTKLLNEISDTYNNENEIINKKRMKDKYLILRYLSMMHYYTNINNAKKTDFKSITDFLANEMKYINNLSGETIDALKKDFIKSYDRALVVFNKDIAFRLRENMPINMIMFELTLMLTSLLANASDEVIKKSLANLINSDNNENENSLVETPFEKNIKYHRDSKENVEQRLKWLRIIVENMTNDKQINN